MERKRFIDTLAVRYKSPSDALQERHVAKRKQRNRDLEIIFDPESHKDYVTGFRRRKQQRRKEAVKSLEKLQRENKLEERAERREARREQYDLGDNNESANTSTKNGGENPNNMEQVFYGCDTRSTVKISVIPTAFEEEGVKQITSQLDLTTGSNTKHAKIDQQKRGRAGHKLSKTALAVLSNTKLKIEGKRKFPASSGKKNTKSTGSSQGKERARKSRK